MESAPQETNVTIIYWASYNRGTTSS